MNKDAKLCSAIAADDLQSVRDLLADGANPDAPAVEERQVWLSQTHALQTAGWTSLTYASWLGRLRIIDELVAAGADVEAQTEYGWRPLMMAAANGQTEAARRLLAAGAVLDAASDQDTAMTWAASEGRVETLRFLLQQGADPDGPESPEMSRALWTAVSYDRPQVVQLLAAHGADLNVKDRFGDTALERASSCNSPRTVASLLASGARDSLHAASARGDIDAVETMISAEAIVSKNSRGQTPVHCAASRGHTRIVKRLLSVSSIAVDDPRFEGVLSEAAWSGTEDTVRFLIDLGCDPAEQHNRPVFNAVASGSPAIVEMLLSHGADPNATDDEGWPLLFGAVHAHDHGITRTLLAHGADVNQKGPEGCGVREALECEGGDDELLALLEQHGLEAG